MQSSYSFMEDVIDESVEIQALHPIVFDEFLAEGWRLLGRSMVRHNFSVCRGKICRTIPLRIRLSDFTFSKSQRQLFKRNAYLPVHSGPIMLTGAKELLFVRHAERFTERRPDTLGSFLSQNPHREPVTGMEITAYEAGRLLAASFFHVGEQAVSGTYCVYDPDFGRLSLGSYTMLLEIAWAQEAGKAYYYHGYCYDVPSAFDYKLNFNQLEAMDWRTGQWYPFRRLPVRKWVDLVRD